MPSTQSGAWYGNGRQIVLDSAPFSNEYPQEHEFFPRRPRPGGTGKAKPAPVVSLDEARKRLRAALKDMKALKVWARPNEPKAAPFVDAYQIALKKGQDCAQVYTKVAGAHAIGKTLTAEAARKEMTAFLEDMDALKEWVSPGTPAWAAFGDAFKPARARALEAATRFAAASTP